LDFFDLLEDPHELNNAYLEPAYQDIIAALKLEILSQRESLGDMDEDNPEILEIISKNWNN